MSTDPDTSWQRPPTGIEPTEDGQHKRKDAPKLSEILEEEQIAGSSGNQARSGSWSVEALVRDFRLGGEEVPPLVASAAPLINLACAIRHSDEQPDINELRRVAMEFITRYERDLSAAHISPERARGTLHCLCHRR